MEKKHITENMQAFISCCSMDGKNRLHNYGRPTSIFFCGLSPNYIVHNGILLSLKTAGLIEGLELTLLTSCEWTLDI